MMIEGCATNPNQAEGAHPSRESTTPAIRYVDVAPDPEFRAQVDRALAQLMRFSENEALGVTDAQRVVREVVLYGTKASFDDMVTASPGWPSGTPVPPQYVGVGEKLVFHVVAWSAYQKIHPEDSAVDYEKLLAHELGHLLHVALLNGNEDAMGPVWFFEGLACVMAAQYPEANLPARTQIAGILKDTTRGNYRDYVALVRTLQRKKSLKQMIHEASSRDFSAWAEKVLAGER